MKTRITASIVILTLFMALLSGCSKNELSDTQFLLDTIVTITFYGSDDQNALDAAFSEIRRCQSLFDVGLETSDVYRINQNAGIAYTEVSDDTIALLKASQKYSELTGGVFDVTAGPLIKLWDVGGKGYVPTEVERKAALSLVNYRDVLIDGKSVMLAREGMSLDFGAIAKGYIADRLYAQLSADGVQHAIINLGGNVFVFGGKPDGSPFNVGVQNPFGGDGEIIGILPLSNASLVSSGAYQRYFERDGVKYHHIMDLSTGAPSQSGLAGVTIVSSDSTECDALSTAVFILGEEKGLKLIKNLDGVECILVLDNGTIVCSEGLEGKLLDTN
jgi:thiamine biosynthesis lipoprotein